jgi:hypothetical protein
VTEPIAEWLRLLKQTHEDLDVFPPAPAVDVAAAELAVGRLPSALRALYEISNGLSCRSFRLYPVFEANNPKKTWDSIQRANNRSTAGALGGDADLLARFLVFADICNGFAMLDRSDDSIWCEEARDEDVYQTDLSFRGFIETMVKNAE